MSEQGAEQSPGGSPVEPRAGASVPVAPASAPALPPVVPVAAFVTADAGAAATPAPRVPGSVDERFRRFPTGMMDLPPGTAVAETGSSILGPPVWTGPTAATPVRPRGIAGWGLAFSIVGLLASLVVGWAFPVALVGLVTGAMALRFSDGRRSLGAGAGHRGACLQRRLVGPRRDERRPLSLTSFARLFC